MEWLMRDSTSHTERSITIWTLGSGVGSRVGLSLGRNGASSSRRSSSNLGGNRDIDGQGGRNLDSRWLIPSRSVYITCLAYRLQYSIFLINLA